MKVPLGIKILSWILIVGGLVSLVTLFVMPDRVGVNIGSFEMYYSVSILLLGVVFSIGLLIAKKWGWIGMALIFLVGVGGSAYSIVMAINRAFALNQVLTMGIGLLANLYVLAYLMRKSNRQLYQISK